MGQDKDVMTTKTRLFNSGQYVGVHSEHVKRCSTTKSKILNLIVLRQLSDPTPAEFFPACKLLP